MRRVHRNQYYSKIAKNYLLEKGDRDNTQYKVVAWGNVEDMEKLFVLFGGNAEQLAKKYNTTKHSPRFAYVMDKLEYESQKKDAIFTKDYITYKDVITRPTRCFILKEEK